MIKILTCVTQQHDLRLLLLSAFICVAGSFTSVLLLARAKMERKSFGLRWIVAAGSMFGCTIWSLHFVALLAYMPTLPLAYQPWATFLSILISVAGSIGSFWIWRAFHPPVGGLIGGLGIGFSISGMHYVGVSAIRFDGYVIYDPTFVAASVFISLSLCCIAMARTMRLDKTIGRVECASFLAVAICGLHFVGMSALTLVPGPAIADKATDIDGGTLALLVGFVSLAIIVATLFATTLEQQMFHHTQHDIDRMRLLSDLTQEAVIIYRDETVLGMNNAGERLFGTTSEDATGKPLIDLFAMDSLPGLVRRKLCSAHERHPEEFEIVTAQGTRIPVELSCRLIEFMGKPATVVGLVDISDRKKSEKRIQHLAHHDVLTDLPNRYALGARLQLALDSSGAGSAVAAIDIDLNRFKSVNDLLGHAAGDRLLKEAVKRIASLIGHTDMLARIGGDEFVVILKQAVSPEQTLLFATNIVHTLRIPFEIDGQSVEIGASAGIAIYPSDGTDAPSLLRAANVAMYQAKEERSAVRFFESSMNDALHIRREMEQELAQAIERGELELFYQPMVNSRTLEIESFEALIRWRHPIRGLVSPAQFIPIAEQADLMGRIGKWVIDTACHAAATWPKPWRVSVNVSPSQFQRSDVPAIVASALGRSSLLPGRLIIEITEGIFINDAASAVTILAQLRGMGVRLALDDFGTGFSSLSYLQMFKCDKIKIDQSFVSSLSENLDSLTIVRAIINLVHNLGMSATAEGVETRQQRIILQELGCDQMQGYLFGRPAPFEEIIPETLDAAAVA